MRLTIAAIGRLKDSGEADLITRYRKRIEQAGRAAALGPVDIIELAESRNAEASQRKADEAERLLSAVARADRRVVLDEHGKSLTSEDFASFVQDARDNAARDMAFLIGGPDGHDPRVREQANLVLSMSHMTLPHGLARTLLVEQLYRALTIISGHPYHRA
jgi:23S rRNA (pseudouridine1915-N3)-methyltransferase